MQPAAREVAQYFTLPDSGATAADFFAAIRSLPWCRPPGRGAPKSSTYCTWPTTGEDDVLRHLARSECDSRPGGGAEHCGEADDSSGCRPVASHEEDGRSGSASEGRDSSNHLGPRHPE